MSKCALVLFAVYVLVHTSGGDQIRSYEGQSAQTVQNLLAAEGKTFDVITQKQFQDTASQQGPAAVPDNSARTAAKQKAQADVKNTTLTADVRLQSLLLLMDLDK